MRGDVAIGRRAKRWNWGMVELRRWRKRLIWANEPCVAAVNNCVKMIYRVLRIGDGFGSRAGAKAAQGGGHHAGGGVGSVGGANDPG